jgi:RimJ/RimL family protein N-acetyltransferase
MLRAIEDRHLEQLREWRNELKQYFREYRELTQYDQAKWYEEVLTDHTKAMFEIVEQAELVGCCGLVNIDWKNRSAEISLYVSGNYVDDKIAPAALKDLMAYGFNDCGLHRLWVEVFDYDDKKARLLESAKFKEEGILAGTYFKLGKFHDSVIYSFLEDAWRSA